MRTADCPWSDIISTFYEGIIMISLLLGMGEQNLWICAFAYTCQMYVRLCLYVDLRFCACQMQMHLCVCVSPCKKPKWMCCWTQPTESDYHYSLNAPLWPCSSNYSLTSDRATAERRALWTRQTLTCSPSPPTLYLSTACGEFSPTGSFHKIAISTMKQAFASSTRGLYAVGFQVLC